MGKKWPFEYAPFCRREHRDWISNHEFQQEWYPFAKQTQRYSERGIMNPWAWYDGWGWCRMTQRNWKKYRKTQWKVRGVNGNTF
jgi:hypothetical protein